jgi:heptose I phosphotransferase
VNNIREDLKPLFAREQCVVDFLKIDGEVFKAFPSRRTLKFSRAGREFFIKMHWGCGWGEIARKLLSLRLPVVSAKTEWCAIRALEAIGVDTMQLAAYGEEGLNPARRKSFIVTEALSGTESLEKWAPKFMRTPSTPEKPHLKHALIRNVAEIARRVHSNGLNHRDFYLCHFLLDVSGGPIPRPQAIKLYLIDLHRMHIRKRTPQRWLVKDIAGLFFSSMDLGLNSTDLFRFMCTYSGKSLRDTLRSDRAFWDRVHARAIRVYRQQHGTEPTLSALGARL